MYRLTNRIPLNTQSNVIATQTPKTPSPIHFPRTTLQKILNIHIVADATTIQYLTSFAALNVFGTVNAGGQIVTQHKESASPTVTVSICSMINGMINRTRSLFENILFLALSVISILFHFFLCFKDYFCALSFVLQFLSYHTFDFVQGLIKNIYIFSFLYKKYTRYLLIPCIHCISSFFISHNP